MALKKNIPSRPPIFRGRRWRGNGVIDLVEEVHIRKQNLVLPVFIVEKSKREAKTFKKEIASMPGIYQFSHQTVLSAIEHWLKLGLRSFLLFGVPAHKDATGSSSVKPNAIIPSAIKNIKSRFPSVTLISDICLCEYTSHGHCGVLDGEGNILTAPTAQLLAKQALLHAEMGADIVAPSAMCDGMVAAIRQLLDVREKHETPILSYAVKYASAYYGPFREAAHSSPQFGNRRNYQMNPACSAKEAVAEALADISEGADMVMVKPAMNYLDILAKLNAHPRINVPLAAYQVSGEYSMLKAAAEKKWLAIDKGVMESAIAMKRAGAKIIITYFAEQLAKLLK